MSSNSSMAANFCISDALRTVLRILAVYENFPILLQGQILILFMYQIMKYQ